MAETKILGLDQLVVLWAVINLMLLLGFLVYHSSGPMADRARFTRAMKISTPAGWDGRGAPVKMPGHPGCDAPAYPSRLALGDSADRLDKSLWNFIFGQITGHTQNVPRCG